MTRRQ